MIDYGEGRLIKSLGETMGITSLFPIDSSESYPPPIMSAILNKQQFLFKLELSPYP